MISTREGNQVSDDNAAVGRDRRECLLDLLPQGEAWRTRRQDLGETLGGKEECAVGLLLNDGVLRPPTVPTPPSPRA